MGGETGTSNFEDNTNNNFSQKQSSSTSNALQSIPDEASNPSSGPPLSRRDGYAPTTLSHLDVVPLYLKTEDGKKFLLLEDTETGDVLMPMQQLRQFLHANYSRKLLNGQNRLVMNPNDQNADKSSLFWLRSFESPANVKAIVRAELGPAVSSSGHIRLVLLPVVYNAMRNDETLMSTPLFIALEKAMINSAYQNFVQIAPPRGRQNNLQPPRPAMSTRSTDATTRDEADSRNQGEALFDGPKNFHLTASKYMSIFQGTPGKRTKRDEEIHARLQEGDLVPKSVPTDPHLSDILRDLQQYKKQCCDQAMKIQRLEQELELMKPMLRKVCGLFSISDGRRTLPQKTATKTIINGGTAVSMPITDAEMKKDQRGGRQDMYTPMSPEEQLRVKYLQGRSSVGSPQRHQSAPQESFPPPKVTGKRQGQPNLYPMKRQFSEGCLNSKSQPLLATDAIFPANLSHIPQLPGYFPLQPAPSTPVQHMPNPLGHPFAMELATSTGFFHPPSGQVPGGFNMGNEDDMPNNTSALDAAHLLMGHEQH